MRRGIRATADDNKAEQEKAAGAFCTQEALDNLSDDVGSLWAVYCDQTGGGIPILEQPPSTETFFREYVHASKPCIIRNCIPAPGSEKAGQKDPLVMTLDDLVSICKSDGDDVMLTCDVTPDGHGDCVRNVLNEKSNSFGEPVRIFVKPEERRMSIEQFRDELRGGREEWKRNNCNCNEDDWVQDDGLTTFDNKGGTAPTRRRPVLYYSRQNDCLRNELKNLFDTNLFPQGFEFAEDAFRSGPPDAVNLWVGDERAVSSMHKDHYENLFYCLSGEKVFTLCPPADVPFLHEGHFASGTFRFVNKSDNTADIYGHWVVEPDFCDDNGELQRIRWIEPDITRPDAGEQFPRLKQAHPITVKVGAGEMLYLPALWYHRVTQTCETVGINWWFDMDFTNPTWSYFNFLQHLEVK